MSFQQEESRVPTDIGMIRLVDEDNGPKVRYDPLGNPKPQYRRYAEIEVLDQYDRRIGELRIFNLDNFITVQRRTSRQQLQDEIRARAKEQIIKVAIPPETPTP